MKKSITFVALTLAAMMAFTGCVDDGSTTTDDDLEEEEAQTTIGHFGDDDALGDFEAAASSLQADCGRITCTVRFNRVWTKRIATGASTVASIASTACSKAPSPLGIAACKVAIQGVGTLIKRSASNYYNNGNCFGIRYGLLPTIFREVSRNSYNCN